MINWTPFVLPEKNETKELDIYPPLIQKLLLGRGIISKEKAQQFLYPDYKRDLFDPFLMKDMDRAVERISQAIKNNEAVIIFGDYDADGVPASALLAEFFTQIGFLNFEVYIPHRHNEQYGLSKLAINRFSGQGVKLIITVDCGITAFEEVKLANSLDIDVIITDHHLVPTVLPEAVAVVDPKRLDCLYPDKMLSGTGVAFKLVTALIKSQQFDFKDGQEKWLLDLVAIATVSDMVPLTLENRALTHFGLKVLRQTRRLGLNYLFTQLRLKTSHLTEDDIGFMIGPRINSAGRMSHASQAYFLLTTKDEVQAKELAKQLESQNTERRKLVAEILQTTEGLFSEASVKRVVVCGSDDWSVGVLGLAASRLVERHSCSFFVWTKNDNGDVKGSCRSDGTINIVELMKEAGQDGLFTDFGGHREAGGFSMTIQNLPKLEERLLEAYEKLSKKEVTPEMFFEAELMLDDVNQGLYRQLAKLAPFGIGNPKPVFLFSNLEILAIKCFGEGGIHLELQFKKSDGQIVKAISFFANEAGTCATAVFFSGQFLAIGARIDLLANLEESFFSWRPELRLRIVDLKLMA